MNILKAIARIVVDAWNSTSPASRAERYLSQAVDIYDLEYRINERARMMLSISPSGSGR